MLVICVAIGLVRATEHLSRQVWRYGRHGGATGLANLSQYPNRCKRPRRPRTPRPTRRRWPAQLRATDVASSLRSVGAAFVCPSEEVPGRFGGIALEPRDGRPIDHERVVAGLYQGEGIVGRPLGPELPVVGLQDHRHAIHRPVALAARGIPPQLADELCTTNQLCRLALWPMRS